MGVLTPLVVIGAIFAVVVIVSKMAASPASLALSNDLAPTEVDGKSGTVSASGVSGSTVSVQFWMFIKDWEYRFGQKKMVLDISDPTNRGIMCPGISLHPTDNALDVEIAIHSSGSNTATTSTGNGETQIVTIENVPLQSWFAVSVTVFQRNVDVYINGRLVKSAVLAGIPKPANGSLTIGGGGGFGGSVCTVRTTSTQLTPSDASAFYSAGTVCSGGSSTSAASQLNYLSLFGYTFVFGVKDSAGKDVTGLSSSDVSNWFSSTKK
jgi:hypothetical protein